MDIEKEAEQIVQEADAEANELVLCRACKTKHPRKDFSPIGVCDYCHQKTMAEMDHGGFF